MPSINIYLNEELFEFVKADKSKIIQKALEDYIKKIQNIQKKQSSAADTIED